MDSLIPFFMRAVLISFMTNVKICGITNLKDALMSVRFGADALGFNFFNQSSRYMTSRSARNIIDMLPDGIESVGVFVNEPIDSVVKTAKEARLSTLQLHGEETPDYAAQLNKMTGLPIIKAFCISPDFHLASVSQYQVDAVLLDAYSPNQRGGTGRTFDWQIAREVRDIFSKMYLAGGLSTGNVKSAVASVFPFAVDACSSLESSPGNKQPELLRLFISEAKIND